MEVILKGDAKEIAAFVVAIQERREDSVFECSNRNCDNLVKEDRERIKIELRAALGSDSYIC